jgi:hypothetical protein
MRQCSVTTPSGFAFAVRKNGEIAISHNGQHAVVLRGKSAQRFLIDVHDNDPQLLMAKVTGNYKRGNERRASG